jgi:pyruvate dehydrogenase E1 component
MAEANRKPPYNLVEIENQEWMESLEDVYQRAGADRVKDLLWELHVQAHRYGVKLPFSANTAYVNTIPVDRQPPYPGDRAIERRIKSYIRWNAMAMVVRANREASGIGGHIASYASAATLYEVGFNHFFRGNSGSHDGDIVYFQGHGSPGIYARAFLEGRLKEKDLLNFRRELRKGGGLPSYPHPRLMDNFWEFPTVSMGLSPLMSIYQARFNRYMEDRGLKTASNRKIWAFQGDGEMDEPESLGAISLAAREKLDNLIWVVNCNLQRLDGPVRGNGKIIQELEAVFRGTGWNVIKVITGSDWDPLLAKDQDGLLVKRMSEIVDGQSQKYTVSSGDYIRKHFWGKDPKLQAMVRDYTDEQLRTMRRGGHDPEKVYAAFKSAVEHEGSPTVVLTLTIKGYGMGEAGEGRNITHQQKKLNEEQLKEFRDRFDLPIPDKKVAEAAFFKPPENSEEMQYLRERREALGGYVPRRTVGGKPLKLPVKSLYDEFFKGSQGRELATTMAFVHLLSKLLADPEIGKRIVPIVPDEARTFGMEALFRKVAIYSHVGQLYEPVDKDSLLYYKEARNGAILEEGITEAGAMSSFIAGGTAHATHGVNMIPFFIFYSMFGFQRVGDLIWAAGDMQAKGFILGGTAGRTTLQGEGLQHQDGNSHLLAYPLPNLHAYDPAYAYEIAVIVREGLERMYARNENVFYYITLMNEFYEMPPMPKGAEEGILRGIYKAFGPLEGGKKGEPKAHLMGSGTILNEAVKAQKLLQEHYGIASDVFSVTSYKELHRDALDAERDNMLHPEKKAPRVPYITQTLGDDDGVFVAASDYVKALPASVARWIPGPFMPLGTDGFGRSDTRAALRDFFEVDSRHIAMAALSLLHRKGEVPLKTVKQAMNDLDIDPDRPNPVNA